MVSSIKTISVIGLGYIGLPTAATFAGKGFQVVGVDVNRHAVDTINQGKVHIVEPDLDGLVRAVVERGNLRATLIPEKADAFIVAVPTPFMEVLHQVSIRGNCSGAFQGQSGHTGVNLTGRRHGTDGWLAG